MEWLKIFPSEEVARATMKEDKPRLLIVNNKRICLALHQGGFFAVQDTCTHNGESLSKGKVNYLGEIVCPWHNYRFALSSGEAQDSTCRDLTTYALKWDTSGVFIRI
ncbi:MAG: Rieske 2Fe-2S domain-containing protein [Cyclobacteriaceae bacterium]|nr:Rieske 2Fe-2S domain-containing protein [Cyclobacteriaceae bacterium]MDH4298803.1 Rieske 2Fe-2S domain-containing protein [Cyclobacteriaceae bacterium]MDH5249719.1 Rieske 2Fe-2S domain-containing protein [Cyclobacteriaceae bacterium]